MGSKQSESTERSGGGKHELGKKEGRRLGWQATRRGGLHVAMIPQNIALAEADPGSRLVYDADCIRCAAL